MAESLVVAGASKEEKYAALYGQLACIVDGEGDMIANMANIAAAIKETFGFWWVGFYRVVDGGLVLGPFQGPIACTRIKYGRGVCGTALKERRAIVVDNVDEFPGHIACSAISRSEIVVPVMKESKVDAVLDIDSANLAEFDEIDRAWLEKIAALL